MVMVTKVCRTGFNQSCVRVRATFDGVFVIYIKIRTMSLEVL